MTSTSCGPQAGMCAAGVGHRAHAEGDAVSSLEFCVLEECQAVSFLNFLKD